MTMRWYVVHTYSGFEKHVTRSLAEHIRNAGMQDKFGEILVPTEEVVEMKSGQKRTSEDRKSTRLNSSHGYISYAVFCLKKDLPKSCTRFKDIAICHGNLFLVDPRRLRNTRATRRMNALYNARIFFFSSAPAAGLLLFPPHALFVH